MGSNRTAIETSACARQAYFVLNAGAMFGLVTVVIVAHVAVVLFVVRRTFAGHSRAVLQTFNGQSKEDRSLTNSGAHLLLSTPSELNIQAMPSVPSAEGL
jgi:hypothetical protein